MVEALLYRINRIGLFLSGLAILAMTVLGGLDVLSNALLHKPIAGTYEATETLMVFTVFLGLGYLHHGRDYVAVDVFYWRMPTIGRRVVDVFTLVLMTLYFSAIAWQGWSKALESWRIGEYSAGLVQFPIYPARFALAIGASMAVVCCIANLVHGGRFRAERETMASAIE